MPSTTCWNSLNTCSGLAHGHGIVAAVVEHAGAVVVRDEEYRLHLAEHDARLRAQLLERGGIALLRHDAADAGQLARREHEPRRGLGVLRVDVLRELSDLDRGDRERARDFERAVHRREMIRVVGVFDEPVEAQQHGEALAVEREARGGERGGAQRIAVDARIRLLHALDLAAQRRREREQVMRERRGLRLHAVRIGGNDRFGVTARDGEQLLAGGRPALRSPCSSPSRRFMRAMVDAMSWRLLPVCSREASAPTTAVSLGS